MRAEPSPELHVRWHLLPLALNGSDSAHLKRQPLKYLVLINALLLILLKKQICFSLFHFTPSKGKKLKDRAVLCLVFEDPHSDNINDIWFY